MKEESKRHRLAQGFTLVEILVVLLVIAMLAALISGGGLLGQDSARERRARAELERIAGAITEYQLARGSLPSESDWTNAVAEQLDSPAFVDPWKEAYRYERTGPRSFRVYSTELDKRDGR